MVTKFIKQNLIEQLIRDMIEIENDYDNIDEQYVLNKLKEYYYDYKKLVNK